MDDSIKAMNPPAELVEEWCRQLFGCDDKPEAAAYELARLGAEWAKDYFYASCQGFTND